MDSIFEVKNLEVIRSGETILKVYVLKINENDNVGIIGVNGAGKTTFEKVLLNRIGYNGIVTRDTINQNVGVHIQENVLNKFLKVKELIEIFSSQKLNEVVKNEKLYSK